MHARSRMRVLAAAIFGVVALIAAAPLSPVFAAATPPSTAANRVVPLPGYYTGAGSRPVADALGNVWVLVGGGGAKVHDDGAMVFSPTTNGHVTESALVVDTAGNAWYTDTNPRDGSSYVSEVTVSGTVRDFPEHAPGALVSGPDGTVWMLGAIGGVSRFSPSGSVTEFTTPPVTEHTVMPDGTLWIGAGAAVYWITPTQTSTTIGAVAVGGVLTSMLVDRSGSVWFAEAGGIGMVTPDHTVTRYQVPDGLNPSDLVLGSDGNVWFTVADSHPPLVYRVSANGQLTPFDLGIGDHGSIDSKIVGPDGSLWMSAREQTGRQTPLSYPEDLIRIAPDGTITRTTAVAPGDYSLELNTSPSGTMWYQTWYLGYGQVQTTTGIVSDDGSLKSFGTLGRFTFGVIFNSEGHAWTYDEATNSLHEFWPVGTTRVWASDRFQTSVAIAQREYPSTASTVVIASGMNYPDGLSAGPVAAAAGAPLLLTAATVLPQAVADEITNLKPSKILVIGGPAAVSDDIVTRLNAIAPTSRLFGSDRYATSRALVAGSFRSGAPTVYVATGSNFPDALSAGGAAGSQGAPLLLVNGSETSLDDPTAQLLRSLHVQHINVVGGTSVLSPGLAAGLASIAPVKRLSGADRFTTAVAVNQDAYASAQPGTGVMIATGLSFPDALSASAWAAASKSPLYVSAPGCVPGAVLDAIADLEAHEVTVVGGPNALSDNVVQLTGC